MKFKLAGLLMFSQVASIVSPVDKSNYRYKLCDDNLFKPISPVGIPTVPDATRNPIIEQMERDAINNHYQIYCYTKSNYERAVEDKKTRFARLGGNTPCLGDQKNLIRQDSCIEQNGIAYAQSCEQLKEDKRDKKKYWNEVVPNLESCNNARRRR